MRRLLVLTGVVLLGLALVPLLAERAGRQPARDAVAAARRELGIELDASRVDVGEVTLFVVQAGPRDGPPVLLLHGFPEFWYAWRGPMARLAARGHRVIVPDQRGYAGSDKPDPVAAYAVERLAADAVGLIEALGHESAFVAGHDWGGIVAWFLALQHPERVRRLAVVGTPHPHAHRTVEGEETIGEDTVSGYVVAFQVPWVPERLVRLGNWRPLVNALRATARPGTFPEETLDLFRSAWDHDGAMRSMIHWYRAAFRFPPAVPGDGRVTVPTLVVLAPGDVYFASAATRRSLDWVADGRLVELDAGSHWILQEEPGRIGDLLGDFFAAR